MKCWAIMTGNSRLLMRRSIVVLTLLVLGIILLETMMGYIQPGKVSLGGIIPLKLLGKPIPTNITSHKAPYKMTKNQLEQATSSGHVQHSLESGQISQPTGTQKPKIPGTKIVLIVAYLRSGSTFTASLFANTRGTFFVFEPLHVMFYKARKKSRVRYLNGTIRGFPDGDVSTFLSRDTLDNWMNCRFAKIDQDSLLDGFHLIYSIRSMKSFLFCVKHKRLRVPSNSFAIKECLPRLERTCNSASMRAFKTIRLPMSTAEYFMRAYPNVKVIHLLRDPRGMFLSQARANLLKKNPEEIVKTFCKRIADDLEISKRILKSGNNNFKMLRYEDLAMNPITEAERLYEFADIEYTDELRLYVNQSTSQNRTDGCSFCTMRGNSTRTAFKWRERINPLLLKFVNSHCDKVFEQLGYIKLKSIVQVRDMSRPSMISGDITNMVLT